MAETPARDLTDGDRDDQARIAAFQGMAERRLEPSYRLANDEGAWQQTPTQNTTFVDGSVSTSVGILVGERGYEGQHVVVEVAHDPGSGIWDLRGYIVEGELPPAPATYADE